jgi:hypothetical protein
MDISNPVLSGLIRKRQEIAEALEIAQGQVRALIHDIDAVDATIRLFAPDLEIGAVRVKPLARRHAAIRHESSRMIFTVLRDAPGALSTREMVRAVMEARGMNAADTQMAEVMRLRLASTLLKLKNRGKITADKENGKNVRWRLAG